MEQNKKQLDPGREIFSHGLRLGFVVVAILLAIIILLLSDIHPALSSFSFLRIGKTSSDDVVRSVGQPDREIGAGGQVFGYELDDDSELMLHFNNLGNLQASYRYLPETRECKRLLGKASGNACGLSLQVEVLWDAYIPGEGLPIRMIFQNIGDEDMVINKRFAANLHLAPEIFRDLTFRIMSPSRRNFVPYVYMNVRTLQDDDFENLPPGAVLVGELNLGEYYDFLIGVEYSFQTIYLNVSDPSDGRLAWKGLIVSDPVSINIE